MSSNIKQVRVMIRANLWGLKHRLPLSLSMVFSITLVVCVLAGFLSMAAGFERVLKGSGSASVAVILGGGARQETGSDLSPDAIRGIRAISGDIGVIRGANGDLIASRELVVTAATPQGDTVLALRGMDPAGPALRDGITMSAGRMFTPGSREIVVGEGIARQLPGFAVGDRVRLGALDWQIVGHFAANGSAFESEIWADLDSVRAGFDRQGQVQSLRLRLTDKAALTTLAAALARLPDGSLTVASEADLYAGQSGRTAQLIRLFGWPLALLMAVGATVGALNTMASSVADRSTEIATLRALGFGRLAAFLATWAEAAFLALVGVGLGVVLSWALFNGWQASTLGANNARMGFRLLVTGDVMLKAAAIGLAIGLIGGALPAISATRLPLTAALRAKG